VVQSEEATEGLCAPGTHNTSKAQYFALVYFKGDIPYLFTALEMFHLQDDLSSMKIPGRMDIGDLPANHHGDQLVVIQFLNCTGSYVFSIPQYRAAHPTQETRLEELEELVAALMFGGEEA